MWMHDILLMIAPTIAVVVGAMFGQLKRKQYYDNLHITMNSRLDELLEATRKQSFAEGKLEGGSEARSEASGNASLTTSNGNKRRKKL